MAIPEHFAAPNICRTMDFCTVRLVFHSTCPGNTSLMTFECSLITICNTLLNIEGEGVREGHGEGDGDSIVESMLESTAMSGVGADTCLPLGASCSFKIP